MTDVPAEAVTLAAVAIHDVDCPDTHCGGSALGHCYRLAEAALTAAAGVLRNHQGATTERQRIRHWLLSRADELASMLAIDEESDHDRNISIGALRYAAEELDDQPQPARTEPGQSAADRTQAALHVMRDAFADACQSGVPWEKSGELQGRFFDGYAAAKRIAGIRP